MFINKLFTHLTCAYLKDKSCFIAKFLTYYFYMKTNMLTDFQICISVPLNKIGFSVECFSVDFSQFSCSNVKILLVDNWLGTRHQIQTFQELS